MLHRLSSAIALLIIIMMYFSACSCEHGAHDLVDEIWHWRAADGSQEVVYLITSHAAQTADVLFSSFATLHYTRSHVRDGSLIAEATQACAERVHPDPLVTCLPPELLGRETEVSRSKQETYLRKALLWRIARSELESADYFVYIDLEASAWTHVAREQLFNLHTLLMQEKPIVAVPRHPCNSLDAPAYANAASIPDRNSTAISSIYDTTFVAVHSSARSLLLPLHEQVLSLICHLMLRGRVRQFDLHISRNSSSKTMDCQDADIANQNAIFSFVSSIKSKHYISALPFSPRVAGASVAPAPAPLLFTYEATVDTASLEDGETCPVDCNYHYWRSHPAFECCLHISDAISSYNAKENYMKLSRSHVLPHIKSVSARLTGQNNSFEVAGKRPHAARTPSSMALPAHDLRHVELTHPSQKFEILLSTKPVILENTCSHLDANVNFGSLQHFRMTVLPENMALIDPGILQLQIQLTLSALNGQDSEYDACAIFAQVVLLRVALSCNSTESVFFFNKSDVNHVPDSEQALPWFYAPNFSGFEVTPNMLTDALRYHAVNVSMGSTCADALNVSVDASVELRSFCSSSGPRLPCISYILNATSQTITHHSSDEKRRSALDNDFKPDDFFDIAEPPGRDETSKPPRRLLSDFTCAGPNRRWPHADQADLLRYGPGYRSNYSSYSMCLLRNVCWMQQKMVLHLPHFFEDLGDFLDFSHVQLGEDDIDFSPSFVFDSFIPADARFAAAVTHYGIVMHDPNFNFGHRIWEDMGGIFHAMHLFDLDRREGRVVLFNSHSFGRKHLSMFPRATVYIDEYPDGTCFEQMVVGFRGMNSFKHGFSIHRTAHSVEFRRYYLSLFNAAHLTSSTRRRRQVIVNMYPKVVKGNEFVWKDVCKLIEPAQALLPNVAFRCVALHRMSFEVQAQVISEATVNVWPNGMQSQAIRCMSLILPLQRACIYVQPAVFRARLIHVAGGSAYGLIFAGDGTSAILLSEEHAKESAVLGHLPWVSVYYLHRDEEFIFQKVLLRALHAAASRLDICPDLYSVRPSRSGCDFDTFL